MGHRHMTITNDEYNCFLDSLDHIGRCVNSLFVCHLMTLVLAYSSAATMWGDPPTQVSYG